VIMIARYIFLVYIFLVFLLVTCQETPVKLPTASIILLWAGFMIMAISAEIMLQKSGLAFKNFHQTIQNLIMNHLDCMIYVYLLDSLNH
jgi:hypothetical protein